MAPRQPKHPDYRGDLQAEIMAALWKLEEGTVEDVRREQPSSRRSAYNTVQTVMQRLAERGLLTRERQGNAFVYRPRFDEAEFLSQTIGDRLAGASSEARRGALVSLLGDLEPGELDEVTRYANRIRRARGKESR